MSRRPDLPESLAWLDYCLGETAAAMAAVQEGALEEMKHPDSSWTASQYHELCESAARIITLKGRAARWGSKSHATGLRAESD